MSNNIFKVISEAHVDNILKLNSSSIVIIMFSTATCPPCKRIKPKFISLAKENSDCFFIYIDINDYKTDDMKYTKNVTCVPKFKFYYDMAHIADVEGESIEDVCNTLKMLQNTIKEKKEQVINNNYDKYFLQKADLLKKLMFLHKQGAPLTKGYNMDSDFDEMLWEYNLHTNPQNIIIPSPTQPSPTQPLDKQPSIASNGEDREKKLQEVQKLLNLKNNLLCEQAMSIKQAENYRKSRENIENSRNN